MPWEKSNRLRVYEKGKDERKRDEEEKGKTRR